MERFVRIANRWKPLTVITKRSILDVAASLDPPMKPLEKDYVEVFKDKYAQTPFVQVVPPWMTDLYGCEFFSLPFVCN